MIHRRVARSGVENQIKSCFSFTVPGNSAVKVEPFRDPIGLNVLVKVAKQLSADGFQVTSVRPGAACDAAFSIKFLKFDVSVILLAERHSGDVDCGVLTVCRRAMWHRVSPQVVSNGWTRACSAIEKVLREDLRITPLLWLTRDEAEDRWQESEFVSRSSHGRQG